MAPATPSKATHHKSLSNASSHGNAGNVQSSAYDPVSGTFHTLETTSLAHSPNAKVNLKFRAIEDNVECPVHFPADCESLSNNGSCSGESEDQKDKIASPTSIRPQPIPGRDTDKQDKIRLKNERKHQRQRERRMKELHDRCTSLLMSRKLDLLSHQLAAMGFPAEEALVALMLNEGRVENSVAWLLDRGIQVENARLDNTCGLKIDISNELAEIAGMGIKFNCTAQDVERIVVSLEGDLEKTAETLMSKKQEPPDLPSKLEESCNPLPISRVNKVSPSMVRPIATLQVESKAAVQINIQQPKGEQTDLNYYSTDSENEILAPLRILQSKSKTIDSISCCPPSTFPTKINIQVEALREARLAMQHPKSMNARQMIESNLDALPPANAECNPIRLSGIGMVKARTLCQPNDQKTFMSGSADLGAIGCVVGSSRGTGMIGRAHSITATSSLGLFTGWGSAGSSGSSSPVDWSMGDLMPLCDYNTIDWSMESTPLSLNALHSRKTDGLFEMRSATTSFMVNSGLGPLGMQGGSVGAMNSYPCEWASAVEESDIFTGGPFQFVTSPHLYENEGTFTGGPFQFVYSQE